MAILKADSATEVARYFYGGLRPLWLEVEVLELPRRWLKMICS